MRLGSLPYFQTPEQPPTTRGARLRYARTSMHWTPREMAAYLGASPAAIVEMESDRASMTPLLWERLRGRFGGAVEWIEHGNGATPPWVKYKRKTVDRAARTT